MTLPISPVWLEADANRLEQVLVNLLDNESKYMGDGGEITISVNVQDDHAIVCVRDAGIGTALVRMLVELHGGTVSAVNAALGRSSEFTVWLPEMNCLAGPDFDQYRHLQSLR